jgi:hypothetical protein
LWSVEHFDRLNVTSTGSDSLIINRYQKKENMQYKVVPFIATINQQKETTNAVANQLESLISQYTTEGWTYIRLESVSTYVQPNMGCFGIGGKPGYTTSYQMVVFSKH